MTDPIETARAALGTERRRVAGDTATYPGPIAGCDAQFNYLLDIRRRFERALAELDRPEPVPTRRQPLYPA